MDLYNEKFFKADHPEINEEFHRYLDKYGVDLSKYHFSNLEYFESDRIPYYNVTYNHNEEADLVLSVTIARENEGMRLESFYLATD